MPNPFKRDGSAYRRGGEWLSDSVGLAAKLVNELADPDNPNLALIGDTGSGKSTALSRYTSSIGESGIVLLHRLDELADVDQALGLHESILNELIDHLGTPAFDQVADGLRLRGLSVAKDLRADQKYALIAGLAGLSRNRGQPVHLLVDECQEPAEKLERAQQSHRIADWFRCLKVLAEVLQSGGGRMIMTITPSPWSEAPPYARARFVPVIAAAPLAADVDAFIEHGLKHTGGDMPNKAARGLGAQVLKTHEGRTTTVRHLHEWLHVGWERAHRSGATSLGARHLS